MQTQISSLVLVNLLIICSTGMAAETTDFNTHVLPVFRTYCAGCHNAQEAEGELVLQDYARTMKGGAEGPVIIAGKSDESPLWKRMTATDDSRMPPAKNPVPKAEELATIKNWIDAGAKEPAGGPSAIGLVTRKIPTTSKVRESINSVAASNDGRWIAIARPHSVEIVDGKNLMPAFNRTLTGHTGIINDVSFSADGRWLCVAAGETGLIGEATLWRTSDWSRGPVFSGHRDALYSAQINNAGTVLATASYDRDSIAWDISSAKPLRTFKGHNDAVYGLSFSSNGKLLATASGDRTVKLWDVATGERLDTFSQPAKDQSTVTFSPDGHYVVAAGVDCRIRVWQISETGHEGTNPILYARFAHENPILKVAFSPDGQLLASSSEDRRIKLWETKTFTQVAVLERQPDWAPALAFTADNERLLVGRANGDFQAYPVDPAWKSMVGEISKLDEAVHAAEEDFSVVTQKVNEREPNDLPPQATRLTIPAIAKGELKNVAGSSPDVDLYKIAARKGEKIVIETNAARDGSLADTKIEVRDQNGQPVLRALLQAVRDSWINFRPIDSLSADVRLEFWEEMDLNQYVYMNGEVCRTFRAPRGPDSGYAFYTSEGKRKNYFDTSAAAHAKDEPVYIVEPFAPTARIVENGLPVFPLYFTNDDDGDRKLGKDSRLTFTAPNDGDYVIAVTDVRGFSGDKFHYTLSVRRPSPDFSLAVNTANPKVPAGSGQRLKFTLSRIDGFDDDVRIDILGLPKGFNASSPVVVEAGLLEAFSSLTADREAPEPTKEDWERVTILATAEIDGRLVTKTIGGLGEIKLEKPAPIRVSLVPDDPAYTLPDGSLVIEPGTTITAKIVIERNGHEDDVRFDVDNLPHGIIVDNIGLSGVLVRKQETERQIFLTARPWVPETVHLIHAVSQVAGNQASPPIRLRVRTGRLFGSAN